MDIKATVSKPVVASTTATKRPTEQSEAASRSKAMDAQHVNPVKPSPVVNSQGQVTGRHLNVTA